VSVSEKYPDGRLQPYVGVGLQYTVLYSINIIDGQGVKETFHPNGWGYQLSGGARYLLNPRIGAFVEGKYQHGDAVSLIADQGVNDGGTRHHRHPNTTPDGRRLLPVLICLPCFGSRRGGLRVVAQRLICLRDKSVIASSTRCVACSRSSSGPMNTGSP
jgi:hypothetical protein